MEKYFWKWHEGKIKSIQKNIEGIEPKTFFACRPIFEFEKEKGCQNRMETVEKNEYTTSANMLILQSQGFSLEPGY